MYQCIVYYSIYFCLLHWSQDYQLNHPILSCWKTENEFGGICIFPKYLWRAKKKGIEFFDFNIMRQVSRNPSRVSISLMICSVPVLLLPLLDAPTCRVMSNVRSLPTSPDVLIHSNMSRDAAPKSIFMCTESGSWFDKCCRTASKGLVSPAVMQVW